MIKQMIFRSKEIDNKFILRFYNGYQKINKIINDKFEFNKSLNI